jgi:hypothetical protein
MFDVDFAKLVHAMWNDQSSWRDLDNQIRTMNRRLASWRQAHKQYGGATHWLTQRTAFEVMVTMQTIYGLIKKPRAIAAAVEPPPRPEPQPVVGERDGLLALQDGTVEAGMMYYTYEPIVASPDDTGVEVIHVSAAA